MASTTLFLAAGRFGLTPSANRLSTPGLKLVENSSGLQTGDPAGKAHFQALHASARDATLRVLPCCSPMPCVGFTATDVLYLGTIGHVVAIGEDTPSAAQFHMS